jgi:hypothetical protein
MVSVRFLLEIPDQGPKSFHDLRLNLLSSLISYHCPLHPSASGTDILVLRSAPRAFAFALPSLKTLLHFSFWDSLSLMKESVQMAPS